MIISKSSETNSKAFEKLFPISEMIEIIEHLNFEFYEFSKLESYFSYKIFEDLNFENEGITYWFVLYLNYKVSLRYSIFKLKLVSHKFFTYTMNIMKGNYLMFMRGLRFTLFQFY